MNSKLSVFIQVVDGIIFTNDFMANEKIESKFTFLVFSLKDNSSETGKLELICSLNFLLTCFVSLCSQVTESHNISAL